MDFRCFYEAGRLVRSGLDPYDRADWSGVAHTDPASGPHCALTFVYPMPTAMAMVPLSLLPEPAAVAAWEIVLVTSVLGGVALASRIWPALDARSLTLVTLWSQPMLSAVANAQFGPVLFLSAMAFAYALSRARPRLALGAWTAFLVKPHITFALIAMLVFVVRRRTIPVAAAIAVAVLAIGLALTPRWPREYVSELVGQQLALDRGLGTLWTVAADIGLPPPLGAFAGLVLVALFARSLPANARGAATLVAAVTAASFLLTPYARPHDQILLAVCWAATLDVAARVERGHWLRLAVVGVGLVLPWAITALTLAGLPLSSYVLVSVASAALLAVALRTDAGG